MALSGVIGAVGDDPTDHRIRRDLVQQLWQYGRVTNVAARDLDRPDLKRFLVDPDMYLAPDTPFRTAVLAGIPFAFTFGLDTSAVD